MTAVFGVLSLILLGVVTVSICTLFALRKQFGRPELYDPVGQEERVLKKVKKRGKGAQARVQALEKRLEKERRRLGKTQHLEKYLTSRINTARGTPVEEDEHLAAIMARGREIYGDAWDNAEDGQLPLSSLLTMDPAELETIKKEAMEIVQSHQPVKGNQPGVPAMWPNYPPPPPAQTDIDLRMEAIIAERNAKLFQQAPTLSPRSSQRISKNEPEEDEDPDRSDDESVADGLWGKEGQVSARPSSLKPALPVAVPMLNLGEMKGEGGLPALKKQVSMKKIKHSSLVQKSPLSFFARNRKVMDPSLAQSLDDGSAAKNN